MQLTISRVVAFVLTPVLTAGATIGSAAAAKYGLHVDPTAVAAFGVSVGTATAAAAIKWLHGRAAFEQAEHAVEHVGDESKAWADAHGLQTQVEELEDALKSAQKPIEQHVEAAAAAIVSKVADAISPAAPAADAAAPAAA